MFHLLESTMTGFPKAIREKVLVDAARHCCVCHRYKAVGVEVHHIVPRSENGEDSEDNAIALCFDCHSAAGHYNASHPKGTKFSREELRLHKAAWAKIVAAGPIHPSPSVEELSVVCRHVATCDHLAIEHVLALDRPRLPFGQFGLLNGFPSLDHMREYFAQQPLLHGPLLHRSFAGVANGWNSERWKTAADLLAAHPEFGGAEVRPLRREDTELLRLQPIWERAVAEGAEPADIGRVFAAGGPGCGDDSWYQEALFRVPHGVFMQIQNLNTAPIRLTALWGAWSGRKDRVDFRQLEIGDTVANAGRIALPEIAIAPMESVLVPEGVFYGPLEDAWFESAGSRDYGGSIDSQPIQVESFIYDPNKSGPFFVTGPWV